MGFKRHILTGEIIETPESGQGRQIIFRGSLPYGEQTVLGRTHNPWDRGKDVICRPLSIKPEDATPERIAKENEEARRHGTGARYDNRGVCHTPTRGSRSREMRRLNKQDNDAGYGDHAGR